MALHKDIKFVGKKDGIAYYEEDNSNADTEYKSEKIDYGNYLRRKEAEAGNAAAGGQEEKGE